MNGLPIIMRRLLLLTIVLIVSACAEQEMTQTPQRTPSVRIAEVSKESLSRSFRVSGVIRPVARANLAFQTDGVVLERLVELGDLVEPDQLLAVIKNPRLQPEESAALATVTEIRTRRDQAQRDLIRLQQLREDKAVGEERVEQKAADLSALEASLLRSQAQLAALSGLAEEASLKAPFAGEIHQIFAEPGEYIRPGQTVMSIGAPEVLEVQVQIPAQYAYLVAGDALKVQIPTLNLSLDATVDRISSQGQANTGLFPMVVNIVADSRVKAGMRADVMVPWQSAVDDLLVPLSAVVDPVGGQPRVYRVVDHQVEQLDIILGQHRGKLIAVHNGAAISSLSPLDEGDQVVVSGHQSLTDGQSVQVLQ